MAKQLINLGTTAGDGTGDQLRVGGQKINDNFDELYENKDTLDKISEDSSGIPLWNDNPWPGSSSPTDHTQNTDQYLDFGGTNQSSAEQVKAAVGNSHAPGSDNQDLSGLVVKETGKSLVADTEIAKIHSQNTDTKLDEGGTNEVTAAAIKSAVNASHAPGSDNQDLSGLAPLTSPNFTDKISIASKQLLTIRQAAIYALKSNYATGELDTEAKIISVINTGFAKINATLSMLAVHGLMEEPRGIGSMQIGSTFKVF